LLSNLLVLLFRRGEDGGRVELVVVEKGVFRDMEKCSDFLVDESRLV